jgi:hypothetical protein
LNENLQRRFWRWFALTNWCNPVKHFIDRHTID